MFEVIYVKMQKKKDVSKNMPTTRIEPKTRWDVTQSVVIRLWLRMMVVLCEISIQNSSPNENFL